MKRVLFIRTFLLRVVSVLALATLALFVPLAQADAGFSNWRYKMQITFRGYNKSETLTNFPVLVVFSNNLSGSGFNYNQFASTNAGDLRFADSNEVQALSFEIEKWNTNGNSYVWVRVPTLASTNDSIWAYWGNTASVTPPASTTNGATWDRYFKGVWHLSENSGNAFDSTSNGYTGTLSNPVARATAMIGGGAAFDGLTGEFGVGSTLGLSNTNVTMESWAYITATTHGALLKIGDNASGYAVGIGSSGDFSNVGQNFLGLYEAVTWLNPNQIVSTGWHQMTLVVQANGYPAAFLDGAPLTLSYSGGPAAPAGAITQIGGYLTGSIQRHFNGTQDEVRVSATARSANWVWAEYMNMASNNVFNSASPIIRTDAGFSTWRYKMQITFRGYNNQETLTNFPVLVIFSNNLYGSGFNFNQFASTNGGDLRFADANESHPLNFEVEKWDTSSNSYVWVCMPTLASSNDSIWAYWGNATNMTPPATTTNGATWDRYFQGVWHLSEGSGNAFDSTSNGYTGTLSNPVTRTTALIGGGAAYDGITGGFGVNSTLGLGTSSVTMESWAYITGTTHGALLKIGDNATGYAVGLGISDFADTGQSFLGLYEGIAWHNPDQVVSHGWHLLTLVVKADGNPAGYLDGVALTIPNTAAPRAPVGAITQIGGYLSGSYQRHFNGIQDEVRISSTVRSANWIRTEYMNISDNYGFNYASSIISAPIVRSSASGFFFR